MSGKTNIDNIGGRRATTSDHLTTGNRKAAVSSHLKTRILTMELKPGADLDEAALCEAFDLSRTPLREVIRDLAGEGYVDVASSRGARVSEMSHRTLRDFFLAAPMIYEAILQLAAENASEEQLASLSEAQNACRAALRSTSVADRALSNIRFHEITGEMAGNVYLLPSFRRLLIDHARIGMTFFCPRSPEMLEKMASASAQHDAIIAAIRGRDAQEAAILARAHWELTRDQIEQYVLPSALGMPLGEIPTKRTA